MSAPGYWMHERSGRLAPAVERYLTGELQSADIALIRAYLRQWINSPVWDANPNLDAEGTRQLADMRSRAASIETREDIDAWLHTATDMGMDPL
ncbi:MAG TPA: hypothetical protein VGG62_10640 [Terracidiphilus sp.]|jgi:hypothetical protein